MSATLYRKYYGSDPQTRMPNDFYSTPRIATIELMDRVRFRGRIWECACGKGAISKVLQERYKRVRFSDIIDYHLPGQEVIDFLEVPDDHHIPNIVTNAPYSLSSEFIHKAVEVATQKVAMLFRLDFLQSRKRKRLFEATGLTDILVFSYRLKFVIDGKPRGMVPYAWYIWDKTNPISSCNNYRLTII